jgi:hypothetical protein
MACQGETCKGCGKIKEKYRHLSIRLIPCGVEGIKAGNSATPLKIHDNVHGRSKDTSGNNDSLKNDDNMMSWITHKDELHDQTRDDCPVSQRTRRRTIPIRQGLLKTSMVDPFANVFDSVLDAYIEKCTFLIPFGIVFSIASSVFPCL